MHFRKPRNRCATVPLLETLEPRQLMSGITKLPNLAFLSSTPKTAALTVAAQPALGTSAQLTVAPVDSRGAVGEPVGGILSLLSGSAYKLPGELGSKTIVKVKIDWGDGTTEFATLYRIDGAATGSIAVYGSHAYNRPGTFKAKLTAFFSSDVVDPLALIYVPPAQVINTTSFTITLNTPFGRTFNARNRQVNGVLASIPNPGHFTKTNGAQFNITRPTGPGYPATAINAYVTWGDGTTGSVQLRSNASGGFDILGSHTYTSDGAYRITLYLSAGYNGAPFSETIQTHKSIAFVGNVPGNLPFLPLTFPLTNYKNFIPID